MDCLFQEVDDGFDGSLYSNEDIFQFQTGKDPMLACSDSEMDTCMDMETVTINIEDFDNFYSEDSYELPTVLPVIDSRQETVEALPQEEVPAQNENPREIPTISTREKVPRKKEGPDKKTAGAKKKKAVVRKKTRKTSVCKLPVIDSRQETVEALPQEEVPAQNENPKEIPTISTREKMPRKKEGPDKKTAGAKKKKAVVRKKTRKTSVCKLPVIDSRQETVEALPQEEVPAQNENPREIPTISTREKVPRNKEGPDKKTAGAKKKKAVVRKKTRKTSVCKFCCKKFTQKSNLSRHIRIVHREVRVQCPHCDAQFTRTDSLPDHLGRFHSKQELDGNEF